MMIEFEKATEGDPDAYTAMIDWCERSQSKAILGGTLTSQADGKTSTNALGTIHDEVRKDLRDSDVRSIAATLTRDLVYVIAAINNLAPDGLRRAPRWKFAIEEPEDLKTYSGALPALVNMGMKIPRQWAQEKLGIPEPEADDDDLLKPSRVASAPEAQPDDAGVAAATAQLRAAAEDVPPDPPARQATRLDADLQPVMDDWIGRIKDLVAKASSLEEVRDGIAALAPDMTLDTYTAAMRQALAAAALAGRYEILREAGNA
jgi:phage gp29-like protein